MTLEQQIYLAVFIKRIEAHPEIAQNLAVEYYAKCLKQQETLHNLEQNCHDLEHGYKELEREREDIYADYELLRSVLKKEQLKNIALSSRIEPVLPDFLPLNLHNYLHHH